MSTAPQQPQTALALAPQGATTLAQARQVNMQLGPQNLEQAWSLAEAMAKSDLVPEQYRGKPANVIAVLFMANDLGIGVTQAMRELHVTKKGTVGSSAALKVSLVLQSGVCELWEVVESTPDKATVRTRRRGKQEASFSFTLEEAKRAGLYPGDASSAWSKYPKLMLRHRAEGWLADQEYPDVVRGLKQPDEIGETVDEPIAPRVVNVPATAAVIAAPPPPDPNALPPMPKAEPHDPVTGEVVEAAPAQTQTPAGEDPIDTLLKDIMAAQTAAELDKLRPKIDELAPKGEGEQKAHPRRRELGNAMNARRTALNGGGR